MNIADLLIRSAPLIRHTAATLAPDHVIVAIDGMSARGAACAGALGLPDRPDVIVTDVPRERAREICELLGMPRGVAALAWLEEGAAPLLLVADRQVSPATWRDESEAA